MKRSRKKQITRILIAVIALITVTCFSTVSVAAEPYFSDTFKFLNHKNLYSCVTFGTETWYINNGGWFRAQDITLNGDKYRFAQYNVGGFWDTVGGEPTNENGVSVGFGVHTDNISVPAGGVLEVKFDWYYNITVDMTVVQDPNAETPVLHTARQVPMTAMKSGNGSGTYFRLKNIQENSVEKWYTVYPTVQDHGLVSGDFYSGNAVYKSTITLRFKNTSGGTLSVHDCQFSYDPVKTFYNRNMKEWLDVNNNGVVPSLDEITAIKPVKSTYSNWVSMGYGINDVPSYQIIQPEDVEAYELANVIGDPSGHDYDDFEARGDDLNDKLTEQQGAEDELVDDLTDKMDDASDLILDYEGTSNTIKSLSYGFDLIADCFGDFTSAIPSGLYHVIVYAICGGVLLAIVGQVFSGISKARSGSNDRRRGGGSD